MDTHSSFNLVEGLFWIILAFFVWGRSFKVKYIFQKLYLTCGILLIAFGCSDFVEMKTEAWWRPWWLLVWKGGCLAGFVILGVWYYVIKKRRT